MQLMRHS